MHIEAVHAVFVQCGVRTCSFEMSRSLRAVRPPSLQKPRKKGEASTKCNPDSSSILTLYRQE